MNIYEKLQTVRVELQKTNLKKSGANTYAGYKYYELADFMPKVNELFKEYKLCGIVSFNEDEASLTIVNSEKPDEQVKFTSPMAEANLKGCHDIQNLGAVETYQRRYLYMIAMEITEADTLDATQGKSNDTKIETPKPVKVPQVVGKQEVQNLMKLAGAKANDKASIEQAKNILTSAAKNHGYDRITDIKQSDFVKVKDDVIKLTEMVVKENVKHA